MIFTMLFSFIPADQIEVHAAEDQVEITSDSTVKAVWKDKSAAPDRRKQKGKDGTWFGKGASIEAAEAALARMTSDKDPKGTKFAPLKVKSTKQTKKSIRLTWSGAKGAKQYAVYAAKCGKSNKLKRIATLTSGKRSYNLNYEGRLAKMKKGTYYKSMVIAVDKDNNVEDHEDRKEAEEVQGDERDLSEKGQSDDAQGSAQEGQRDFGEETRRTEVRVK